MSTGRFCFCLPLRFGAILVPGCQLILVGILAAVNWYALESMRGSLPNNLRGIIVASALYYSMISIAALIGLFGAIRRNANLLSTYASYLAWLTGVQIFINVSHLILFFKQSRESLIQNCIDGSTDTEVQNICNNSFDASKWSIVVSMVVGLIIQFWAAYVATMYAEQIKKEKTWPGVTPLRDASGLTYADVQQQDDNGANVSLAAASHAYPYKDGTNSFGGSVPYHYTAPSV